MPYKKTAKGTADDSFFNLNAWT